MYRKLSRKLAEASRTFSKSYRKLSQSSPKLLEHSPKYPENPSESSPKLLEHFPKVTEKSPELCARHYIVYTFQYFKLPNYLLKFFRVKYTLDTIFFPLSYLTFTRYLPLSIPLAAQYTEPRISPKIHLEHSPKATETLTENLTQHFLYVNNLQYSYTEHYVRLAIQSYLFNISNYETYAYT